MCHTIYLLHYCWTATLPLSATAESNQLAIYSTNNLWLLLTC